MPASIDSKPPEQCLSLRQYMKEGAVKLPSSAWNRHEISMEGIESVCFAELRKPWPASPAFMFKSLQVTVHAGQLKVSQYILEREVGSKINPLHSHISEQLNIAWMLAAFHECAVCSGRPEGKKFPGIQLECAAVYRLDVWRHKTCSLLLGASEIQCLSCQSVDNTLRVHKARKEKRVKPARIRVMASSLRKAKFEALRKQRLACYHSKQRLQNRKDALTSELRKCKERLNDLRDSDLEGLAKKAELPEAQIVLLTECVAAAKATSKQARRYRDNWLLLCLLLQIRSPAAYRFLRGSNILPLPCVKTVRKYVSAVGMKCGFDAEFFLALKKKLEARSEFQKHGMLLFDEIQVRERKCVESRTLTYIGFVDNGNGNGETSALANHALVFMFCPFGENYAQPIGVFASRGATKGTVLSQLVLQAIVMLEEAGAIVDGIVCDGASTNRKMWTCLGVSGKLGATKHFFEYPISEDRKVYVFSDVPHLFKCIRNRLLRQRLLKVKGEWVKWWFYASVYKEHLKNAGGLQVVPK
ncbi:hypothetical protein HPB48_007807 [Haemaphysalis longicornis]|uniref:Transposable element P transposase-like RNase H domain-containing protein n=1 Tax=Haemaphysalis longicornis TaxID=44386 RepID=A0A9J6FY02_HAELO|nr:hypothetical protein HPB48_007807 [Haemaphysalis longicornis]